MACVISISSDEEDFEDGHKQSKRIKLDCSNEKENNNGARSSSIIVLDDDEDDAKGRKLTCKSNVEKVDNFKKIDSVNLQHIKNCVKVKYTSSPKNPFKVPNIEKHDGTELNTLTEIKETVVNTQCLDNAKENTIADCEIIETKNTNVSQNAVQSVKENSKSIDGVQNTIRTNQNTKEDSTEIEEEVSGPSTCKASEDFTNCKHMQELIDVCLAQIENSETRSLFKSKIPICKALFDQVDEEYKKSELFIKDLEEKIALSKKSPFMAVQCFNDIYKLLKVQKKYRSAGTSNTNTKHSKIIRKLEHTLKKLRKRIKGLEEEEINFEEEEDSSYIKLFRYQERAVKVYEKLCKYRNEDPHYDSIMHNRLDFSGSRLPEFNKAINRKYKNNMVFPTYYDLEQCLKKCVDSNNMEISESGFKAEVRHCFEKLGNLIQYRRKMDLLDVHSSYVPSNLDPAIDNPELNSKLQSHYKNAKTKTDEIYEKYSRLQETGENPELSTDSDDSNVQQSEDETER